MMTYVLEGTRHGEVLFEPFFSEEKALWMLFFWLKIASTYCFLDMQILCALPWAP